MIHLHRECWDCRQREGSEKGYAGSQPVVFPVCKSIAGGSIVLWKLDPCPSYVLAKTEREEE